MNREEVEMVYRICPFPDLSDTSGGSWRLRYGMVICPTVFSWELHSNCRIVLTGGIDMDGDAEADPIDLDGDGNPDSPDLDGDGFADVWTLQPEPGKNAEARLIKLNKRQQFDDWGLYSMPFRLIFVRSQFEAVLN